MSKAVALYGGGIHFGIEVAVRDDGKAFERFRDKTPWGYRWTRWIRSGATMDLENLPTSIKYGFSTLYPRVGNRRLP